MINIHSKCSIILLIYKSCMQNVWNIFLSVGYRFCPSLSILIVSIFICCMKSILKHALLKIPKSDSRRWKIIIPSFDFSAWSCCFLDVSTRKEQTISETDYGGLSPKTGMWKTPRRSKNSSAVENLWWKSLKRCITYGNTELWRSDIMTQMSDCWMNWLSNNRAIVMV